MNIDIGDIKRFSIETEEGEMKESFVLPSSYFTMSNKEYLLTVIDLFGASYGIWFFSYIGWMAETGVVNVILLVAVAMVVHYHAFKSLIFIADQFGFTFLIEIGDMFKNYLARWAFRLSFVCLNGYFLLTWMLELNSYGTAFGESLGLKNQIFISPSSPIWLLLAVIFMFPFLVTRNVKNNVTLTVVILVSIGYFLTIFFIALFYPRLLYNSVENKSINADVLWWSKTSVASVYTQILYSFAIQANLMDIYSDIPNRSPSKIRGSLKTQMYFSAFIYISMGLIGYFSCRSYENISESSNLLNLIFAHPTLRSLSVFFMLLTSANNVLYGFRPFKDSIVKLLDNDDNLDVQTRRALKQKVVKDINKVQETSIGLLIVVTGMASMLIASAIDLEARAEILLVIIMPFVYIILPVYIHTRFAYSARLYLIMMFSLFMWSWAMAEVGYKFFQDP